MKKTLKKTRDVLAKFCSLLFLLFFGWVVFVSFPEIFANYGLDVHGRKYGGYVGNPLLLGAVIILVIAAALIFWHFLKKLEPHIDKKTLNIAYVLLSLIMLAAQIKFLIVMQYQPANDCKYVDIASHNFASSGSFENMYVGLEKHDSYFDRFPNNWYILLTLSFAYRGFYLVFGSVPEWAYAVINLISIHIAVFFLFLTAKETFKSRSMVIFTSVILLLMPVMYLYAPILYTDTLSMPFVTAAVYCGLRFIRSKKFAGQALWALLAALLVGIGYCAKGSVAVLAVAFAAYLVVKGKMLKALPLTASLAAGIILVNFSVQSLGLSLGLSTEERLDRYKFPMVHWVMMGMVGDGGFDHQEFRYTGGFKTYDERVAADKERIKQHIDEYDMPTFYEHLRLKTAFTWSDAKYYAPHHLRCSEGKSGSYFVQRGKKLDLAANALHCVMLAFMLFSCLYGFTKRHTDRVFMIRMAVFGLGLFLLIWETRSRYLVNFVPLFAVMAADGVRYLEALFVYAAKNVNKKLKKQDHKSSPAPI